MNISIGQINKIPYQMLAMQIRHDKDSAKDIGIHVVKDMFKAYKISRGTELETHTDITTITKFINTYYSEEEYPEMWI